MRSCAIFGTIRKLSAFAAILFGLSIGPTGCDGGGNDTSTGGNSSGYAPSSLVGKTMKIGKWLAHVTFVTSSEAKLTFEECIGTCTTVGTPSYAYNVTGSDTATFKLSYSYTEKYLSIDVNRKTTGDQDLTLTFSSASYGTATGSQSYTLVNYETNKTSDVVNTVSTAFTLVD
jgi:hypothetical protein